MVKVDLSGAAGFFTAAGPDYELAALAHKTLADKSGLGNDFTGWVELPRRIKETELDRIVAAAEKIRSCSKALVVIGIGGSYLGARGAIELLKPMPGKDDPKVFFMGNTLSTDTICDTIAALGDMDFDVNVISKSGTTLEPAVSFRIFREILAKKYGDKADEHIFATTDEHKGVLHGLAEQHGWESFVVPDDVGGRFSVLSAVGLCGYRRAPRDRRGYRGDGGARLALSGEPRMAVRRGAAAALRQGLQHRAAGLLRAELPLHGRMVEAALR